MTLDARRVRRSRHGPVADDGSEPQTPQAPSPAGAPGILRNPSPTVRFFSVYLVAWLPIIVTYAVMIGIDDHASTAAALYASILSVAPGLGLGIVVRQISGAVARYWSGRGNLFLIHSLLAIIYALVWACLVVMILLVWGSADAYRGFLREGLGWQLVIGIGVYAAIAGVSHSQVVGARLRAEETRAAYAEAVRNAAELRALRAQLDPHFIFNTLHSILELVHHDPKVAEDAIERFARMLRYVLTANQHRGDEVLLVREWRFVEDYLEIERLRLGDRLRVELFLDPESGACVIPVFTLQPLVENAIRHSVAKRSQTTSVRISAHVDDETLVLTVSDNGMGPPSDMVHLLPGVGLRAIEQRIALRYPAGASMRTFVPPDGGFAVEVRVPAEETST
jgi:signal transduction histidine kinase